MFNMPPAIFQELTSVAKDTGLTVDQIIQEAIVNWIRAEAPAHMRNTKVMKDFSTYRHPYKVIESGRAHHKIDALLRQAFTR